MDKVLGVPIPSHHPIPRNAKNELEDRLNALLRKTFVKELY